MLNKQPFVSIIIANHNGRKLMKECLDSLFGMDYPKSKFEIIVVDNHSSDNSVRFIRASYKKVNIIENEVNNYCLACNRGIRKAKGDYICLLNNDVRVKKDWLEELIKVIKNDNSIGAVTSKLLNENGVIQNAGLSELPNFYWDERGAGKKDKKYNIRAEIDAISGACVLYRRKALEKVGLLDEDFVMFGEDVDMSFRLEKKKWKLIYVPESAAYHKFHGSCDEKFARELIERNRLLFIAKHYPFKLADALLGNKYFIVNDSNKNSGRIFDFMPDVFIKLSKEHGQQVIKKVVKNLFEEFKRIINYENKRLEEDLNNILMDLTETKKDRDCSKNNEKRYIQDIHERNKNIEHYKEEISNLSNKLKEGFKVILDKDNAIHTMERRLRAYEGEITNLNNRLRESLEADSRNNNIIRDMERRFRAYQKEINILNNKLKKSLDVGLFKDNLIRDIKYQSSAYKKELNALSKKLRKNLDSISLKDKIIHEIEQKLDTCQKEIGTLNTRLKQSLDTGLLKDNTILEKQRRIEALSQDLSSLQQELTAHKEELSGLALKLKESLDAGLLKDSTIVEIERKLNEQKLQKEHQLQELSQQISAVTQELDAYKQEAANLADRLKQSLDTGLLKDDKIIQLSEKLGATRQELQGYKEETLNLTNKLKESLNMRLNLEKELNNIYTSEGFRFVLKPLWKIICYSRLILSFLMKQTSNIIWTVVTLILSPFILIQVLLFLCEHIIQMLFGWILKYFRKKRKVVSFNELSVSVVIPDWNGIDLLKKCLSSIYEADGFKNGNHEVLVVDDASSYSIAQCIKEFPRVRVIRNRHNQGFGRTCNRGVKEAKGELIVLLNNDIMVSKNFLAPLKEHFRDPDVFAVSPKLYYWDKKKFNYGMHMGKFKDGYLSLWNEAETGNGDRISQAAPTVFAVGGAICFRKKDFLWLGGFDDIYRPNSWEDIDISYRAQKRGLKVIYEPASLLYHKGAATVNYLRHKEIKNELLFMWKNLTDQGMLLSHINQLTRFLRCGRHSSRTAFLKGYLWALGYFISALTHKFRESKYIKVSDKKILNRSMLYYRNFMRNNYMHRQRKTVLLITPFIIYPLNSGGKIRIYNLYKRLKEKYDLILLSLIHNEEEKEYADSLKDIFKEIYLVHTKTPSREFLFPRRYKYSYSSFFIEKLLEIQERTAIDAVHIESNELLYLTKHIKYIPVVYTEHDISVLSCQNSYYQKYKSYSPAHFIDYLKIVRYHSHIYHRIDKVITLSKEDIGVIKAFSPHSDCLLIPTGVDLGHFSFREKTGRNKSLIFIGHYPHYPNEEAALYFCHKILPLIRNKIPEVTLKLVGSGPTEKMLELCKIKGVEVVGEVSDVNPYLQEAAVFVCAFRRSAGIKGKVLEAMATGTPVVSTTRGSYGIDAINGLEILIADKPADFAGKVITLLKDDELYQKISRYARMLAGDQYDWEKIVGQLDAVYRDIMDEEFICQPEKEKKEEIAIPENSLVRAIIEKNNRLINSALDYLEKERGNALLDLNPEELHLELTHLCNSRCITCDIWDFHKRNNKNAGDELTLDEIRNFIRNAKRLRNIKTVVLSGGEPFLRPDLVDICRSIKDILPQASLGILTNGLDTEAIISKTKHILGAVKPGCLWIGSSLDGLGEAYDRIRGTQGGFSRFQRTVERFKKELPGISFSTTFVLTPFNIDELVPCWEFADKNGLDFFAQFGVPKQARSKEAFQWQESDFIKIEGYIAQIIEKMIKKTSDLQGFYNSLEKINDKINLLTKIYYWAGLVDFQKTKKRFAPCCEAASKFAMFDPYGNMFFCPILKDRVIGNIRDKGLDDLWVSQEAHRIRDFIKGQDCSCWLVCMVFPIVDRALSLYRDRLAISTPKRIEMIKSNLELNDEEFGGKKIILQSFPQGITLGANYKCNANCLFCLGGEYKPFSLKLYRNYFERQLGNMISQAEYVSLCGMGELLLAPDIKNFLQYINTTLPDKNKILTTNGLALGTSLSDIVTESIYSIQISLHASNARLHERLTGLKGGFDKIIEQVRHIVAKRKSNQSPHISLVFLANTMNIEDLPNFIELAAHLNVDGVQCNYLTIFQPAHLKLSCFFMQEITNTIFDRAMQRAKDLKINLKIPPKFAADDYFKSICSEPWKNIYVDTEGAVLPCCYSGEHFGELGKENIFSIWNNAKFKGIRTDLASGNPIEMCKYCLNNNPANVNLLNAHVSFRPEVQKLILN